MNTTFVSKRRRDEDSEANKNPKRSRSSRRITSSGGTKRNTITVNTQRLQVNGSRCELIDPHQLRQALMSLLDKIFSSKVPKPFRTDLAAIKDKLISEKYVEPWDFIADVSLMFEITSQHNLKASPNYEYLAERLQHFEREMDSFMQSRGYCCGKMYKFDLQELCCSVKEACTIPKGADYFSYQVRNESHSRSICESCFTNFTGNTVTFKEPSSQLKVNKKQFVKMKNNVATPEPFVKCGDCGRRLHEICVLYLDTNWPDGFFCDTCLALKGTQRTENRFRANNLPATKLDVIVETRVNQFLKRNKVNGGQVNIRVLFNYGKIVEVLPEMRSLFVDSGEMSGQFPYKCKALFAFQEIDGADVCFFGMYVQEYGSDCASPNTGRVYITFLDSVNLYQPRNYRTAVYQEILLGYMEYVKQLGYAWVHIWACPPPLGENYIFFRHPADQKIPDSERLLSWYTKILQNGKREGIIVDYKSLWQQSKEDNVKSVDQLPYFDEDYWPNFIEGIIKDVQTETTKAAQIKKRRTKKQNDTLDNSVNNVASVNRTKMRVKSKLFAEMEIHRRLFFSVRLHPAGSVVKEITDPDTPILTHLMDGHTSFFDFSRDNNYEFSSLRRAQFSTLRILYELHNQDKEIEYICNSCELQVIETRYHCRVCDDYDLCVDCYRNIGHVHEMDRIGSDDSQSNLKTPNRSITNILQSFVHACSCSDLSCRIPSCKRMRAIVLHVKFCQKTQIDCQTCRKLNAMLSCHSQNCQNVNCSYPFCRNTKIRLQQQKQQQEQQKLRSDRMANIASSLMKISVGILDNRDSSSIQQAVVLNAAAIEIARVQEMLLKDLQHMYHSDAASLNASMDPDQVS